MFKLLVSKRQFEQLCIPLCLLMLGVLYKRSVRAEALCASKTSSVVYVNSGSTAHKNGKLFKLTGRCHKLQPHLTDHEQLDSIFVTTLMLCLNSMSPLKLPEEIKWQCPSGFRLRMSREKVLQSSSDVVLRQLTVVPW